MNTLLGVLSAVAGIVGGVTFMIKFFGYKTPADEDQKIDDQIAKERQEAEKTGRPV